MISLPSYKAGRHFLQIPGPTNVPDRILRAIDRPTIDHRGKEFARLGRECLEGMKPIFKTTKGEVFIFPASGTGAWEAAIVNTLSPGDHVLMVETGHFAALWRNLAQKFGLIVDYLPGDWRHGIDAQAVAARLAERSRSSNQSGDVRSQRNVDRRNEQHCGGTQSDGRGKASGAVNGRYGLLPGQHRLSARRMGGRRDDRRLAKRTDVAARTWF